MDSALRCLRDGVVNGRSAPFVLLQDSSDVLGGPAVAAKLFSSLCKALREDRSQARTIVMVPTDDGDPAYMRDMKAELGPLLQQPSTYPQDPDALQCIVASVGGGSTTSPGLQDEESIESKADASVKETASHSGKAELHAESKTGSQPHIGLGIDSISMLMFHHPTHQVLEWVDDVLQQPALSCLAGTLHTDLHEDITVKSLERMAACTVRVLPVHGQGLVFAGGQQPDLAVEVCIKQRTGRVKAVTEYHQHLPDGSLREVKPLLEAEAPLPRPQARTTPAPEAAGVEAVAQKISGGMRLTLTQQESAARQSVLLPWEQRQVGAESQDEFVRPAGKASMALKAGAGAEGAGTGYGQIFYERDSETDPDSDEDPDDDLDI